MKRNFLEQTIPVVCDCKVSRSDELVTKPNLAMTPAQVKALADKGVPVNTSNSEYMDTSSDGSFNVEAMFQRDMDTNTLWETQKRARKNVISAHKSDKQKYG